MVYELTCPACSHTVTSPFVRVGAVVLCPACSGKYRIADAHVRRAGAAPAVKPAEAVVQAAEEGESTARQLSDGSVAGLSGLTELMEQEPQPPADTASLEAPPPARVVSPNPGAMPAPTFGSQRARHKARILYFLAGILGLAMAALGGALWWAVISDREVSLPPPSVEEVPLSPEDAASIAALPLLTAELVPDVEWKSASEPYRFTSQSRDAYLRDEARMFVEDGREFYTATVTADTPDVIEGATLRLVLVDMTGKAVARGTVPVGLFGAGRQQKVRVPFPDGLPNGLLRVDSWVEVEERLTGGRYLNTPEVRPVVPGSRTLLRLRALNTHDVELREACVLLRALDEKGGTIARYKVKVPWPLEPRMQLAIRLALPPPGPSQAPVTWSADAAARSLP